MLRPIALAMALALSGGTAQADVVLFENVRVFDGTSAELSQPMNVLVRDNLIERISPDAIEAEPGATVIDGAGDTLMPGLIDAHWHTTLVRPTPAELLYGDVGFLNLVAGDEATNTLMRGFTTVRDMGGPAFGLKQAIDAGIVVGPRIYPSGAIITVTSGHGDFRPVSELPRTIGEPSSRIEQLGGALVADSPDEVRVRAREQLMLGASQIKLTAGGGVASPHSPIDVSTFTLEELRAAVEAAGNWGTYVAVHAYTPEAIQRSIAAGVKVIEHGHLMDDATAQLMAEKGIWLSTQPFVDDEDAVQFPPGSPQAAKKKAVSAGTDSVYALAKKYGLKTAFGTDILFSPAQATRQGAWLARMLRWYTPAQALAMATSVNGELLQLTGLRNPYPGRLGEVEEGALADLLLVDGDPIADIDLLADPANLAVIMKDGRIYKNTVGQ
ncbi:MAG TPA: amidohydrolase family protein [Amaricoccus sp.]|uniref:metal-dependent hydrolase family protein n=1 Tax=Amaricoccus sp. TaxID=1872485 RepID=UPI002B75C7F1|nr:amidohydrolase family protein [Amaricoccus sp.]HMQ94571.1 amidohydrolase family protein [Amaricoccus sp.]HMR52966.1 amidohydrolase family protein [Amaricoccus sp.]HMR60984.1 amidohydrolase family protein [Amaricoccus sp.]HMT99889.1 amidohydrolase family protein [Amaricoccus sp.]